MIDHRAQIERQGFAILRNSIPGQTIKAIISELAAAKETGATASRSGKAFAIRNLLNVVPATKMLANSKELTSLVESVLGAGARVVRAIYLDKHRDANWKVAWHQDLTIAVKELREVTGYGPWSMKAAIQHVQPPVAVLEDMLAVRVHLDDADESNGTLRVLPGSHLFGRLSSDEIQRLRATSESVSCAMKRGDVMLMRPLLLHASSVATNPGHRRVLHFEYAVGELEGGLEWYEG